MKWVQWITLMVIVASSWGCKLGVVLRDPEVYENEIGFLQMALEQDTELLEEHLTDGSCTCDDAGSWNSDLCETTALNILVIQHRLEWHVEMMRFLGKLTETRPSEVPPEVPETSTLCPGG
jgi:hypothetical protein